MMIPHVVQTEADKVFVNILNNQTVSVTDGDAVVWNTSTPDGVRTTQPLTATLSLFVGLVDGTVASGAYGLAQAYGYKSTSLIIGTTAQTIVAGNILVATNSADYLSFSAASDGKTGFVFAAETVAQSSTTPTSKKVFIRAL